ncbi:MAG: 30S ribosomal protein S16 [Bacteroidales bacterium]|jgi:small subunit ribosomal protein S16|nr:30S ribosomal protein S16 [Bacteroidales bacterium]
MPAKIRLQRFGKKGRPFYHIVIADGRAPRDGRSIENLGIYDPLTNPATIELNFEKALHWIQVGAQPTDTVRAILSYKGVMYKNHLAKGVAKGALTEEQAEVKFNEWLSEKEARISAKKSSLDTSAREGKKSRLDAETKVNEARMGEINKRKADELAVVEAKAAESAAALAAVAAEKAAKEAPAAPVVEAAEEVAPVVEAAEEVAPDVEAVEEATPVAKEDTETPATEENTEKTAE